MSVNAQDEKELIDKKRHLINVLLNDPENAKKSLLSRLRGDNYQWSVSFAYFSQQAEDKFIKDTMLIASKILRKESSDIINSLDYNDLIKVAIQSYTNWTEPCHAASTELRINFVTSVIDNVIEGNDRVCQSLKDLGLEDAIALIQSDGYGYQFNINKKSIYENFNPEHENTINDLLKDTNLDSEFMRKFGHIFEEQKTSKTFKMSM